jgi:hypothetical protein
MLSRTITERVYNAHRQALAAREAGDVESERVWREATDRLLDTYSEQVRGGAVD